jgi:hypothetical protein
VPIWSGLELKYHRTCKLPEGHPWQAAPNSKS